MYFWRMYFSEVYFSKVFLSKYTSKKVNCKLYIWKILFTFNFKSLSQLQTKNNSTQLMQIFPNIRACPRSQASLFDKMHLFVYLLNLVCLFFSSILLFVYFLVSLFICSLCLHFKKGNTNRTNFVDGDW